MYAREKVLTFRLTTLDPAEMRVSIQSEIGIKTIRFHRTSSFNGVTDEPVQGCLRQIRYSSQPNSPDTSAVFLHSNSNQLLFISEPTNSTFLFCSPVGLVHFDSPVQPISSRPNHRLSELVQHRPGRLVAPKPEDSLQPERA